MRDSSKNQVELIFIRHGKTIGNTKGQYIGVTNEPLCDAGKSELTSNEYPKVKYIFASPMLRCIETARIIYPKQDYIVIDEFREMNFGDFEGKSYQDLNGNEYYQRWIDSGGTIPFPNGDSREEFINRVMQGFNKMCEIIKEKNVTSAAVVVHGGTIMAILSKVLGGEYFDYQIKNGEIYKCSITL